MSTEIIINAANEETRVALLENKILTEMFIDRRKDHSIVGNVYKGRVVKVLPGMQSAFVDIGLERAAFLHVADVAAQVEEHSEMMEEVEEDKPGPEQDPPRRGKGSTPSIEEILQEGQEIVVQISKEPRGTKGARVTTYLSLPGRYLVYMPTVNHVGVSRRIEREEERSRLREMVLKLRKPGVGYIIRTVSEGLTEEEFRSDIQFLERLWQNILTKKEVSSPPALLHTDLDLAFRIVRDLFTTKIDRLVIDAKAEYGRIKEFVDTYLPALGDRIQARAALSRHRDALSCDGPGCDGSGRR